MIYPPLFSRFSSALIFLYKNLIYHFKQFFRTKFCLPPLLRPATNHFHKRAITSLNRDGYFVVNNYVQKSTCKQICTEFADLIVASPDYLHQNQDTRAYGVEKVLPSTLNYFNDNRLRMIGDSILRENLYCAFTLANRLTSGKMGSSGEGWHRDAYFGQYKALLYLTDVDSSNGPFEIIPKTHKFLLNLFLILRGKSLYNQDRYSDESIASILNILGLRPKTITAKAGTLILFNATCLHRGKPIESSQRIALTNYYFPLSRNILSLRRQFWPVIVNS